VFGAGGGTCSYREAEDADLLVMWGSNAREAHPIFFHHVLKGVRRGARLYAVDPRRTTSAQWADAWLGIEVGSDISLANAIGREIIEAGLVNETFVERATTNFEAYAASVKPYTLDRASRDTGVPADLIQRLAHDYARADRAQICWTLGITEHHNATDNVLALINLSLLTGHVGRYGSGLVPLRGQNNVQGGGDMGAIPSKLTGFQDVVTDMEARARFEAAYGTPIPPEAGWHLSLMFEAMERGELTACYIIGENPLRSEADTGRARKLLGGLEHFVVQDIFLTDTAALADVVLPATATWCEAEGTVTSSERRVQRVRKALEPPPGARDDIEIICEIARRLGADWGHPSAEDLWNELRTLSPMHAGMSYQRLEDLGGIQWPCYDEQHPGEMFLHARLWEEDPAKRGTPAPFTPVEQDPPIDELSPEFPLRLTTGRRLDSFNTGVQSGHYATPIRRPETLNLSPEDATRLGLAEGEVARVSSRRGSLEAPVHIDETLRAGLAFMTLHFPEQVATNVLTLDVWDPKSGTAEFKATAIRVDRPGTNPPASPSGESVPAEVEA
jgi:predicted molibdopterin-dependent oxidoreductase YjgC